jgi:hypothetical protein
LPTGERILTDTERQEKVKYQMWYFAFNVSCSS